MKNLGILKLGVFVLMLTVLFTACELDTNIAINSDNTTEESLFLLLDQEDSVDFSCVEFAYPMTLNYPDGSTVIILDDLAFETVVNSIDPNAPLPTLVFPIQIIEGGVQRAVATEEELCDIFINCFVDEDDYGYEEECFIINYPITLTLPDGTQSIVTSDNQLESVIDTYYDNNPSDTGDVGVVYPVSVTLLSDNSTVIVNNDAELEVIFESCHDDFYEKCFEIQFPISMTMSDSTIITANNEMELDSLTQAWIAANPNVMTAPTLIFPITVIYDDGTTKMANNEIELMDFYIECFEFLDDCDGMVRSSDIIVGTSSDIVEKVIVQKAERK